MKKIIKHAGNIPATIGFAMSKANEIRTKERFFHANGSGFYGNFTLTKDLSEYTTSQFLTDVSKNFQIAIRFSNTVSDHGTPELLRDNRGFSIRFFGHEENWDLVGLSTPINWADNVESTAPFHEALNKDDYHNMLDYDKRWNFLCNTPSGFHIMTMIYSDTGIPRGWQNMNGYGGSVFSLINKNGERVWVKFHFKTQQGREFYSDKEAAIISFDHPDKMTRDMNSLIATKNFPKWKVYVQISEENKWKELNYNMFSPTNIWPHKDFPLIEIGEIELNRSSENQIKEFENIALSPSNLPKGMGLSPDLSLCVRAVAYPKMQEQRLGKKVNDLPSHIKEDLKLYKNHPIWIECQNKQDQEHYYLQPRNLWNLFTDEQKNRLYNNIAKSLSMASQDVIERVCNEIYKIHPDYANGVLREVEVWRIERNSK